MTEMDSERTITLVYASYSYREALFNWLVSFQKSTAPNTRGLLIICLDPALHQFLHKLGATCHLHESNNNNEGVSKTSLDKNTVKSLWVTRVMHITALLRQGINVLLSDLDAVWLRDVRELISSTEAGSDIVASRAMWPYNSPWGGSATLCMGLVFFRSNARVVRFAEGALRDTIATQDDQVGFNHALYRLASIDRRTGALLPPIPFYDARTPRKTHRASFGEGLSNLGNTAAHADFYLEAKLSKRKPALLPDSESIRVTLLAHTTVARVCSVISEREWKEQVYVAHCHVHDGVPAETNANKGNSQSHTAVLVKYGLTHLVEDWERILTTEEQQTLSEGKRKTFAQLLDDIKS